MRRGVPRPTCTGWLAPLSHAASTAGGLKGGSPVGCSTFRVCIVSGVAGRVMCMGRAPPRLHLLGDTIIVVVGVRSPRDHVDCV